MDRASARTRVLASINRTRCIQYYLAPNDYRLAAFDAEADTTPHTHTTHDRRRRRRARARASTFASGRSVEIKSRWNCVYAFPSIHEYSMYKQTYERRRHKQPPAITTTDTTYQQTQKNILTSQSVSQPACVLRLKRSESISSRY